MRSFKAILWDRGRGRPTRRGCLGEPEGFVGRRLLLTLISFCCCTFTRSFRSFVISEHMTMQISVTTSRPAVSSRENHFYLSSVRLALLRLPADI